VASHVVSNVPLLSSSVFTIKPEVVAMSSISHTKAEPATNTRGEAETSAMNVRPHSA
jgi:hypothetical protein